MATLALSLIGAGIGSAAGLGITSLGLSGAAVGWTIGGLIGSSLQKLPGQEGPRLEDLASSSASYGAQIPRVWGSARIAGSIIWAADLIEQSNTETVGGKGGPSQSVTTYNYFADFAIKLCEGPIAGVRKIWADAILIYDATSTNTASNSLASQQMFDGLTIYTGTESQDPDPLIESYEGAGNVPANRGDAYLVFDHLQIAKFGNRIPNITAEVIENGAITRPNKLNSITGHSIAGTSFIDGVVHTGYQDPVAGTSGDFVHRIFDLDGNMIHEDRTPWQISPGYTAHLSYHCKNNYRIHAWQVQAGGTGIGVCHWQVDERDGGAIYPPQGYTDGYEVLQEECPPVFIGDIYGNGYLYLMSGAYIAKYSANDSYIGDAYPVITFITGADYREDYDLVVSDDEYLYISGGSSIFPNMTYSAINKFDQDLNIVGGWNTYPDKMTDDRAPFAIYDGMMFVKSEGHTTTTSAWYLYKIPDDPDGAWVQVGTPISNIGRYATYMSGGLLLMTDCFLYLNELVTESALTLSTVVSEICQDSGLSTGDIDVSALTDNIIGFSRTGQQTGRGLIDSLRSIYLFDMIESDGKLKAVKRGGSVAANITDEDLGCHIYGQGKPDIITITRQQEVSLPNRMTIQYINQGNDYQPVTQQAIRRVGNSISEISLSVPVVFNEDNTPRQIAEILLFNAWTEREQYEFSLPLDFINLDPGDRITLPINSTTVTARLISIDNNGSLLSCRAVRDETDYDSIATGGAGGSLTAQVSAPASPTDVYYLDIPALRHKDNDGGYYVAGAGYYANWSGAVVYESSDDVDYTSVASLSSPATVGYATDALATGLYDRIDSNNTVNIVLRNYNGSLSSITYAQLFSTTNNVALLGDEIIQYQYATQEGDGSYTLSNIIRARAGTEQSSHVAGERFILLNSSSLYHVSKLTSEVPLSRYMKTVTIGRLIQGAATSYETFSGEALKPWSPVNVRGSRDGSNNLTITWDRRNRIAGRALQDPPQSESSESYEVDIIAAASPEVVRTISSISSETTTYTAAQQTADGLTPGDPVTVRVYQLSADVGRGRFREEII